MTYEDIKLSVALVTRDRPDSLRRAMASLAAQQDAVFEIVVSDDSSDDHVELVRRIAETYGCRYQRGPRRGLYANRNAAAMACTGTHVRTMDDDHVLPPGHVTACMQAVRSHPDAVWVIGEVHAHEGSSVRHDPIQLHPRGFGVTAPAVASRAIADGCTIYPRAVHPDRFLMAECFSYGPTYLQFGSFLASRGIEIRTVPDAVVEHHFEPRHESSDQRYSASRYAAMLTHSFAYARSARNIASTTAQIAFELTTGRRRAARALGSAVKLIRSGDALPTER